MFDNFDALEVVILLTKATVEYTCIDQLSRMQIMSYLSNRFGEYMQLPYRNSGRENTGY